MRSMYKVGDVVRCTDQSNLNGLEYGKTYTIEHVKDWLVYLVGLDGGYNQCRFVFVSSSTVFSTDSNGSWVEVSQEKVVELRKHAEVLSNHVHDKDKLKEYCDRFNNEQLSEIVGLYILDKLGSHVTDRLRSSEKVGW